MKNMRKLFAVLLTIAAVLAMVAGCTPEVPDDPNRFDEQPDENRTQLYVGYYNGGIGLTWLMKVKEAFEARYPEYQIMIDTGKDEYMGSQLEGSIKTNRQDMYVGASFDYYDFVKKGLIADVSDAITSPLTEFGESKSIKDKVSESLDGFFNNNGAYYAMPLMESYHHMIYDVDLFDEYDLWFKDGGGFVSSSTDKKSAGHDGEYGTYDDGLPVTYSEFFALCDRMVARGITPITWSGQYADSYLTNFIHSAIADYEGSNFMTNWDYDGQATIIVNKNFVESEAGTFYLAEGDLATVTVTKQNFSQYMYASAGKYYAAKFAKDLVSNPMYRTYNYAESHTGVQRSFLMSNMEGVDKPIAMLIEGHWWMNESTEVFNEMAAFDEKYAKENRRFGIMPFPKADDGSSADGHTMALFSGDQVVCISNFTDKKDIATLFLRFLHTDECMKIFTRYSGVLRPYDYDLTEIYDSLSYYTQNMIDMRADTEYVFKLPTVDEFNNNHDMVTFMVYGSLISTRFNGQTSNNPMIFFCDNTQYTAKDYYLGIEADWAIGVPNAYK